MDLLQRRPEILKIDLVPLCIDADRFVRDLETGFRTMWRDWCERRRRPKPGRARALPANAAD